MGRGLKAEHMGIWLGNHDESIKEIIYSIRRLMQADEYQFDATKLPHCPF